MDMILHENNNIANMPIKRVSIINKNHITREAAS